MKKVFGALAVAALLASCSVLDQKVVIQDGSKGQDDPIGLKGKAITVSLLNNGAVRAQGVNTTTPIVSDTFADYTIPPIPAPAVLKGFVFELALATSYNDAQGNPVAVSAVISGANKVCPATFDLTAIGGSVKLSDGADTTGVTIAIVADPTKMTFTQTSACTYSFTSSLLTVTITGDAFTKAKTIFTNGNNLNQVSATLNYTSDNAVVKGQLDLKVGGGKAFAIGGI